MIANGESHQVLEKFTKKREDYTVKGVGVHKTLSNGRKEENGFFKIKRTNTSTLKDETVKCMLCTYCSNGVNVLCAGGKGGHWTNVPTLRVWMKVIVCASHVAGCEAAGKDPLKCNSIVHTDAYPVYISAEFRFWLADAYPQLLLVNVQASYTSVMQIADVAYNRPLKNSLGQHHMHSIIEAAGQQLDSGTPVQDVDVRYIFGGVAIICGQRCQNNMWPKVFDWLLKAYGALSEVNVQSALDQIGYSNCWPSGDGYCTPFQSAFLTVKELFNAPKAVLSTQKSQCL